MSKGAAGTIGNVRLLNVMFDHQPHRFSDGKGRGLAQERAVCWVQVDHYLKGGEVITRERAIIVTKERGLIAQARGTML